MCGIVFFQAEDGIRDLVRSRGLGDVYKRQILQAVISKQKFLMQSLLLKERLLLGVIILTLETYLVVLLFLRIG